MSQTATKLLEESPMSAGQFWAIMICILLSAIDGFDIAAIAFAAPGIAAEWNLSEGLLGWVMTMELIGMAFGSAFLGNVADRIGRRPVILFSVAIITAGMFVAAVAPNVYVLSAFRILTGVGIGAVLAGCNALVAELSNGRNRNTFVLLMTAGYGVGAVVGGAISTELLEHFDWRSVFYLGAAGTAIALPLACLFLPESISYLANKQPKGALEKINAILAKFGHHSIALLPDNVNEENRTGLSLLFGSTYFRITALLSIAFLAHVSTYYFVLKWVPKLVVDMGFTAAEGGSILVWAQIGTLAGALMLAFVTRLLDLRWLVISMMTAAAIFVIVFGQVGANLSLLAIAAVVSAFFNSAAAAGLYPLIANYFPTEIRAGGTGVVVAIGRGGAVAGPVIAGYLLQADIPLAQVAMILSLGSVLAGLALWRLGPEPGSAAS